MRSSNPPKPPEFSPVTIGVAFVLLSSLIVFLVGLSEPDARVSGDSGSPTQPVIPAVAGTAIPNPEKPESQPVKDDYRSNETHHSQGKREYGPRPLLMPARDREYRSGDGKLVARSQFQKDKTSGQFTFFHANGWAAVDGPQKGGLPHGLWKAWHQNGTIAMEGEFRNGLRQGVWMYYDTDGSRKRREIYSDDRPAGVWIYWDADGQVWWKRDWTKKKTQETADPRA